MSDRRCMVFHLRPQDLLEAMTCGPRRTFVIEGLPLDAKIEAVAYDFEFDAFLFRVWSATFLEVEPSHKLPRLMLSFRIIDHAFGGNARQQYLAENHLVLLEGMSMPTGYTAWLERELHLCREDARLTRIANDDLWAKLKAAKPEQPTTDEAAPAVVQRKGREFL